MIQLSRRVVLSTGLAAIAAPIIPGTRSTWAQDAYPSRPLRMIVPWPPGGVTDVVARLIALKLSSELGQPVVVDNRPGASGTIGHAAAAQAEPDGYTLLFGTNSTYAMAPYLLGKLPYDNEKSFAPISLVARSPHVLCAHPSVPVDDFRGFLEYVRARQPDGVTFSSAGPGSSGHLATELLMSMANFRMLHVPYRWRWPGLPGPDCRPGSGELCQSGRRDAVGRRQPYEDAGAGLTQACWRCPICRRFPAWASRDSNCPRTLLSSRWVRTPEPIIQRLNTALVTAIKSAEVSSALHKEGAIIVAGSPRGLPGLLRQGNVQVARHHPVARDQGTAIVCKLQS